MKPAFANGLREEDFLIFLQHHIQVLDPSLSVIDQHLPILSGLANIDLVVSNSSDALFLVKIVDQLNKENFFDMLKCYDWASINQKTLQHLYAHQISHQVTQVELCVMAHHVSVELDAALKQLQNLKLKIYLYEGSTLSDHSGWSVYAYEAGIHESLSPTEQLLRQIKQELIDNQKPMNKAPKTKPIKPANKKLDFSRPELSSAELKDFYNVHQIKNSDPTNLEDIFSDDFADDEITVSLKHGV